MTPRNPKQDGTDLFDCKPQTGPCHIGCNECFYNRPGAFYVDPEKPHMPTVEEVGEGILRVNSGHDSNINPGLAISATSKFPRRFFNTSLPRFSFPAPVVFTANRHEEVAATLPCHLVGQTPPANLMFVRLRVSATNLDLIEDAVREWTACSVPVVLTFMAYYSYRPVVTDDVQFKVNAPVYEWRVRNVNSYWCATEAFRLHVLKRMKLVGGRLVSACGRLGASGCRDCLNCKTYYLQTMKHLEEV